MASPGSRILRKCLSPAPPASSLAGLTEQGQPFRGRERVFFEKSLELLVALFGKNRVGDTGPGVAQAGRIGLIPKNPADPVKVLGGQQYRFMAVNRVDDPRRYSGTSIESLALSFGKVRHDGLLHDHVSHRLVSRTRAALPEDPCG
jgi:hypothetical protein